MHLFSITYLDLDNEGLAHIQHNLSLDLVASIQHNMACIKHNLDLVACQLRYS